MAKPFLTYEKQVENLVKNKKLCILDYEYAMTKLRDISYYALIDGYKNLFYDPMTRTYDTGTYFEDIVALYEFDENLRSLVFQYLCRIEQKMRSLISYVFCEKHSQSQTDYLTPTNYNYSKKNKKGIDCLIKILSYSANKDEEHPYVVYQRKKYNNVPLWVTMNTLTMGQTSKMYSFLTTSMQSKISINFKNVSEKELAQYLRMLTQYRNICAHNERLFSFQSRYEIPDTLLHARMLIQKPGTQYMSGKHDLFAVVISFRYLLEIEEFTKFKRNLTLLLKRFEKKTDKTKVEKLLVAMGFPGNWKEISKYKK